MSADTGARLENELLNVKIQTPDKVVWEGVAEAVSSVNENGPFDILPGHANIITLVESQPVTVVAEGGATQDYRFNRALISVADNRVTVFAEIGGAAAKTLDESVSLEKH